MANGTGGRGKSAKAERRLNEVLDELIPGPFGPKDLNPIRVAAAALHRLPNLGTEEKALRRRLLKEMDGLQAALPDFRARLDHVRDPTSVFDPSDTDTVGRLVALALLSQDFIPLGEVPPTYGSGVYALYYVGDHPAYAEISNTENPIYIGKADPASSTAKNPREQGTRLFGRLADHRKAIATVQAHAEAMEKARVAAGGSGPAVPILRVQDFTCRRLVCTTHAQLVAEQHLIRLFLPAWNSEMKICFGISKHGDAATTRANNRSPWDVLHPGRAWAVGNPVRDKMTAQTITTALQGHFAANPPLRDRESYIEKLTDAFRQLDRADAETSSAAAEEVDSDEPTDLLSNSAEPSVLAGLEDAAQEED